MISLCPYCNSLKSAREDNHFCSQKVDLSPAIGNNIFYASTAQLQSGLHHSRLTIRYVNHGYQYYEVEGTEHMLCPNRYLIVNEGQSFHSEIKSEQAVELLIIAFRSQFMESYQANKKVKTNRPPISGLQSEEGERFFESTYPMTPGMKHLLDQIMLEMKTEEQPRYETDYIFELLAKELLDAHFQVLHQINALKVSKSATKIDLYQRISLAKDYIDVHLGESLSLADISQIAAMSTYHFLRTFKHFYGMTPYQYLTQARMDYAQYLLQYSNRSIAQIATECGFENHSAFGRVYKKVKGQIPVHLKRNRKH